jgi:Flp pilus assembly protein TadD
MLHPLLRAFGLVLIGCAALGSAARADDSTEIARLFAAGEATEAFAQLERALTARPRDPQLRFQKGVMLAELQRSEEAAAVFTQLSVDYPELPEPYNNLAVIHAARGDFDKARASLEAALRAQPAYAVAHQNLGDIYTQLARRAYAQALQLDPSNGTIPPKLALLRDLVTPVATAPNTEGKKKP